MQNKLHAWEDTAGVASGKSTLRLNHSQSGMYSPNTNVSCLVAVYLLLTYTIYVLTN